MTVSGNILELATPILQYCTLRNFQFSENLSFNAYPVGSQQGACAQGLNSAKQSLGLSIEGAIHPAWW